MFVLSAIRSMGDQKKWFNHFCSGEALAASQCSNGVQLKVGQGLRRMRYDLS